MVDFIIVLLLIVAVLFIVGFFIFTVRVGIAIASIPARIPQSTQDWTHVKFNK
jgi:hypothetical protein